SIPSIEVPLMRPRAVTLVIASISLAMAVCGKLSPKSRASPRPNACPRSLFGGKGRTHPYILVERDLQKMPEFRSDFLRILSERGFIHQTSDDRGLDDLFSKEPVTAYIGYDPTANSLHV